jgi:hypothetical protein
LSFEKISKMICYPHYLLASPRNIGVHTSTLKYASTIDISTTGGVPASRPAAGLNVDNGNISLKHGSEAKKAPATRVSPG